MARTCPHCGCSDIDEDAGRGDATCMRCGTVLEESIVVAENQFQERAGGSGHTLVGQFVSLERGQAQARAASHGLVSQESREVTFARGRKLIEEIASQLRINQHCIDTSYNFFKMSVSRNLTRGRVRSHVVAACLYMTCRLENTAHLLLDFSDVTQVNMFDLGRTLNFLSRSLRINLPSTDPCLYIMRFACLMELGEKLKEVVNLATRLVQRMKRDWMSMGRRPTGLCGAALLLAASGNLLFIKKDAITVRKCIPRWRLFLVNKSSLERERAPQSPLELRHKYTLECESDPSKRHRAFNFNRTISDVVKVVHISESVVRKRLDEFSKTPSSALTIDEFSTIDLEHEEDPPAFRESRRKAREEQMAKEAEMTAQMEKEVVPIEKELERALEKKRREKFRNTRYAKIVAGDIDDPEVGVAEENLVRNEIMDSVYRAADGEEERPKTPDFSQFAPTLHSLGISPLKAAPTPNLDNSAGTYTPLPSQDRPDGSLDLSGIDDDEIDTYILTAKESEVKERFWMRLNGEHLKEMERRRKEREEEEEKEKGMPSKKKRRRTNAPRQNLASSTAIEAMEKIIHEKRLSNKVNYEILKEIEQTATGTDHLEREPAQVIENVNDLVATLAMDKITKSENLLGNTNPFPLTPENMSRRERELARKNKPLKDATALRVAFKMEPSPLLGGVSEVKEAEPSRPIALSRCSRHGRGSRPNLSRFGVRNSAPNTGTSSSVLAKDAEAAERLIGIAQETEMKPLPFLANVKMSPTHIFSDGDLASSYDEGQSTEQAVNPSETTSQQESAPVNVKLFETKPVPLNHPEPAKRETGLLTRSRRVCAKPRVVVAKDRSVEEGASRDLPPKQVIALNKEPKSSIENSLIIQESSAAVEEVTGSSQEATVANELSETGEKAPKLLRRGRRPLIKPVLPKTQAAIKEIGKTSQINDGNVGVPDEVEKPTVVINSSVTSEESKSAAALTKELDIISPPRKRPCLRSPERHHSPKLLRSRPRMSAKVPRGSGKQ